MDRFKLKLLYLLCGMLLMAGGLAAQDPTYFVYIQHEKQQPFYVKLNGQLLSSSTKGYVILPRLHAGKVPVTIGFPKSEAAEQQYVIRLAGKRDYGFLLKGSGDDYALYDLQTFATLKSGGGAPPPPAEETAEPVTVARISSDTATPEQKELIDKVQADVQAVLAKSPDTAPKKKGSFAEALDKVVVDDRPDDMPLEAAKPKPVRAVETAPAAASAEESVEAPVKKPSRNKKNRSKDREALTDEEKELLSSVLEDEKKAAADEAVAAAATEAPAATEELPAEPVKKVREKKPKKKKDGPEPEFIDFGAPAAAPAAGEAAAKAAETAATEPVESSEEKPEMSAKEARDAKRAKKRAEREAADREALVKDSLANAEFYGEVPVKKEKVKKEEEKKPSIDMVNSDCGKVLEVEAFRRLLRTMNSKKKDEDMVDAFRRGTRSVCVSTEQVRALTQLISSEDNRYQLLDAAYPRTYDSQNFRRLGDLLKDDYYKGRFDALIKR